MTVNRTNKNFDASAVPVLTPQTNQIAGFGTWFEDRGNDINNWFKPKPPKSLTADQKKTTAINAYNEAVRGLTVEDKKEYGSLKLTQENPKHKDRDTLEKQAIYDLKNYKRVGAFVEGKKLLDRLFSQDRSPDYQTQFDDNNQVCASRGYNIIQKYAYQHEYFKVLANNNFTGINYEFAQRKATLKAQQAINITGIESKCDLLPELYHSAFPNRPDPRNCGASK